MADYAFRTIGDRMEIQRMWENGLSPKEIAGETGKSLDVVYTELSRGRDGSRLPDQRLRYSAELAQRKVQQSLERRGRKARKPTASEQETVSRRKGYAMKRKEIKWRREGRGTMAGRQDGIIFRIFRPWDAPERGHTVSCYDTKETGRTISTAGYREFTWEEAVEFCQKIAAGEIDLEDLQAQFDAEDMAKEREAVRKTTEKAKRLAAMLERYGMKYTDLLELEVMRQALGEMGHQILMGYHRGEGWPDGT